MATSKTASIESLPQAIVTSEKEENGPVVMTAHPRNEEDAEYLENSWKSNRGQDIYI